MTATHTTDLRAALGELLTGGGAGDVVRDDIGASWERSAGAGLTPDHLDAPYEPDLRSDEALVRAAFPVLNELEADLAGAPVAVVLSSASGHILDRRVADGPLKTALDSVLLAPGFVYSEHAVGTNGIGTALAQRRPAIVNGDEHFADALTSAACAGAPIFDRSDGRIRGVLDLTCSAADASDLMLPFAVRAARQIEDRLLDEAAVVDRLLLQRFLQARRSAKSPFVLVTDRTVLTNAAGDHLIDPSDHALLQQCARRLRRHSERDGLRIVLHGGDAVSVHPDGSLDRGTGDALLLHLKVLDGESTSSHPRRRPDARFGWESLTDTECSVADLVAEGLTNREAADRLFLSHHTVGFHLRSIFRKLDVSSRVELARLVSEHQTTRRRSDDYATG